MDNQLQAAKERLQTAKSQFVEQLESVDREDRSRFPEEGWNMLQVMEHVIISDQGTFAYLKKKTQARPEDIPAADEQSDSNGSGLQKALLSQKRWKMPEVVPAPTGAQSYENLLSFWDQLYTDYFAFLTELDPAYFKRQVFNHPIVGRIDLYQTLAFQANHLVHHGYQLERIKTSLGISK